MNCTVCEPGQQVDEVLANGLKTRLLGHDIFRHFPRLLNRVLAATEKSIVPVTRRNYRSSIVNYIGFCRDHNWPATKAFPTKVEILAAWMAHLTTTVKTTTAKSYLTRLETYHQIYNLDTRAFRSKWLERVVEGLKRWKKDEDHEKRPRWPLTHPQVARMLGTLNKNKPEDALMGAVIAVGFLGGPRPAEYLRHPLSEEISEIAQVHPDILWEDLTWTGKKPKRILTIQVKGSKKGEPYQMRLPENDQGVCAVYWIDALRRIRLARGDLRMKLPVFTLGSETITVEYAKDHIKKVAMAAGYADKTYTMYSLRRGLATSLFLLGAPVAIIKAMGRWTSGAYKRYIEIDPVTETLWHENLAASKFEEFGRLTIQEAAQMKLSKVDWFVKRFKKR